MREVRSPNTLTSDMPHPRRGAIRSSNPSWADEHQGPHSGGKGWTPVDLRGGGTPNSPTMTPDRRK